MIDSLAYYEGQDALVSKLNDLGGNGWEAVCNLPFDVPDVSKGVVFVLFKKPVK